MDKETEKFAADVLQSIRQMKRAEVAQAHSAQQQHRTSGRPEVRGSGY